MSCSAITFLQYFKSIELGGPDLGPSISLLLAHALFFIQLLVVWARQKKRQKEKGRGEEGGNKMLGRFLK